MDAPCLKGSVFDALMYRVMDAGGFMVISWKQSVVVGSYLWTWEDVYSDTRKNPWNAVSITAHSMCLSCKV